MIPSTEKGDYCHDDGDDDTHRLRNMSYDVLNMVKVLETSRCKGVVTGVRIDRT